MRKEQVKTREPAQPQKPGKAGSQRFPSKPAEEDQARGQRVPDPHLQQVLGFLLETDDIPAKIDEDEHDHDEQDEDGGGAKPGPHPNTRHRSPGHHCPLRPCRCATAHPQCEHLATRASALWVLPFSKAHF